MRQPFASLPARQRFRHILQAVAHQHEGWASRRCGHCLGDGPLDGLIGEFAACLDLARAEKDRIEAARPPGPDVARLLEAARELIAADHHPDTRVWLQAYDRFRLIVAAAQPAGPAQA